MKIDSLLVTADFKYLWLKRVQGIDLYQHCARCLIGEYDKRISCNTTEIRDVFLENGVYYLCGVSRPYVWQNNFHIAFCDGEGTIEAERNGIRIVISGARELPIAPEASIINNHPKLKYKSYSTCRNWQFANWLHYSGFF